MSQRVVQGGTVTLSAYYRNAAGILTTPDDPLVSILDPGGTTVVSLDTPTEVLTGFFQYEYPVPIYAPLGGWSALWFGVVDGVPVDDEDVFTVITPQQVDAGLAFVTVDDLENFMQRVLTVQQRQAASVLIDEVIAEAEDYMGEAIGARTWTEELQLDPRTAFAPVRYGPIITLTSVVTTEDGETVDSSSYEHVGSGIVFQPWWSPPVTTTGAGIYFPRIEVTYVGGITVPRKIATLANVVKGRVSRQLLTAMNQAIGLESINVEGYSAQLVEDDWTEREKRILGTRRSRVRGPVTAPPPPVFDSTSTYTVDEA